MLIQVFKKFFILQITLNKQVKILKEKPSLEYYFYATKQVKNSITHEKEPYYPKYKSFFRHLIASLIVVIFIGIATFFHIVVIILRLSMHHFMFLSEELRYFFCRILFLIKVDLSFSLRYRDHTDKDLSDIHSRFVQFSFKIRSIFVQDSILPY